jgi:hypothetical protein
VSKVYKEKGVKGGTREKRVKWVSREIEVKGVSKEKLEVMAQLVWQD